MADRVRLREGRKAQCCSRNRWWEVISGVGGHVRCRGVAAV